jgi:hypothetical protein
VKLSLSLALAGVLWAAAMMPAAGRSDKSANVITASLLGLGPVGGRNSISVNGSVSMSPDEQWLAIASPNPDGIADRIVFYSFATHTQWELKASRAIGPEEAAPYIAAWRDDSAAVAVNLAGEWLVVEPKTHQITALAMQGGGIDSSCASWSPNRKTLALFDIPALTIWEGQDLKAKLDWATSLWSPPLLPGVMEWRPWECGWSPDGRFLFLRFYGQAERGPESSGHLIVIDPNTGKQVAGWGAEAAYPHWLDASTLLYLSNDVNCDRLFPYNLPLALQSKGQREVKFLPHITWYSLNDDRQNLWALNTAGALLHVNMKTRKHRTMMRSVVSCAYAKSRDLLLVLTRQDEVYLIEARSGRKEFIGRWPQKDQPMKSCWRILGWGQGQQLPLVLGRQAEDGALEIRQLHIDRQ